MPDNIAKKILIVEDEKELMFGLATLLKSQGYLIIAANDSLFGISLAHKEKPDLIILDLGLPAGGGFYVLENLKNSVGTFDIPILVLTAQQGLDLEEKAKQMGAVAYFHKPFEPELLLSQIKEILNKSN
ncbi:MAG: response regulator [Candidatus Omnitrophica bacterium]|nr:response regulator [Candidatus Omnitrophota bacterium]